MSYSARFSLPTNVSQVSPPRYKYDGYNPNLAYDPQQNYPHIPQQNTRSIPQQNTRSFQSTHVLRQNMNTRHNIHPAPAPQMNIKPYYSPAPQNAAYFVPVPQDTVQLYGPHVPQQSVRSYNPPVPRHMMVPNVQQQSSRPYPQSSPQQNASKEFQASQSAANTTSQKEHVDRSLRVFTGRVLRVREWLSSSLPFPVLYRVYGRLVTAIVPNSLDTKKGTTKKVLIIEDLGDSRQKIRCCFQEVDRELGTFHAKENLVVVGRGLGDGLMQVFSVESFKSDEVLPHLPRMENFAARGIKMCLN